MKKSITPNPLRVQKTLKTYLRTIMRIFLLIISIGLTSAYANPSYTQTKIDIDVKELALEDLFKKIQDKSEFIFFYKDDVLDKNIRVSLELRKATISEILDTAFTNTDLIYKIDDRQVVINKRPKTTFRSSSIETKQTVQELTISGVVSDVADGTPLPGVSVLVQGTSTGVSTDFDGKYSIKVPNNEVSLEFSFIGYKKQIIAVGDQTTINVKLVQEASQLDEVVIIGYGSVKKSDLTGSVASITAEDIVAYPTLDAVQALQGRAAGISVQSTNGEPGSGYNIRIRGNTSINASNDPLIVVDGLIGGVMPPPEDIQSVEILKDASSTAIYGARGANGVVIVTTKRGKDGKARINFSSSWSSQKEINRLDILNADQFTSFIQEIDPSYVPELTGEGTDWQDEIYRAGGIQNYQLSVAGGTEKVNYYLSGAVFDQKGIVRDSDYNRYSITSNIDIKASKTFNFGASLFARRTNQDGIRTQEGGDAAQTGVISGAYKFPSTQGLRDANGDFSLADRGFEIDNPFALATELTNETARNLFQGSAYMEINIVEGLQFKTTLGSTVRNDRRGQYYPRTLVRGDGADGEATLIFSKSTSFINENYLTYTKTFAEIHDLTVMAGYSFQKDRRENIVTIATGFLSDSQLFYNLSAATDPPFINSTLSEVEYEAFFGRLNYTLNDKYLFTLTARREGASPFAKNNKYAFFPSAAFGWKVSNEGFLSDSNTISLLKLRASWGQVGNQAIGAYQSQAFFSNLFTTVQGDQVPALFPSQLGNSDLTWETTTQTDIGLDLEILKGRIGLTMDYYLMRTEDLLFDVPVPTFTGFQSQLQNIGIIENNGFEFAVNAGILESDFKWNTNFNISFNNNKIIKLIENETPGNDIFYSSSPLPGGGNTQLLREGESVGTFWGFVYDGVSQAGDVILVGGEGIGGESFRDLNGDGELTEEDRTIIGNPHPDFTWGWNNDFSYKNLSLNIFIQGSQGAEMLNYTAMELGALNGRTNTTTAALNRWTPTNTDTDIPMASSGRSFVTSDRWVEDASYIRLKNISLGYDFSQSALEKIHLRSLRIYISGQNLITITDYSGIDPEVAYSNSSTNLGLDFGSYPNVKSFTIGLNVGL